MFVSRKRCSWQSLGYLTCAHMLMHAVAYRGCANTVRKSAMKADQDGKSLVAQGSRTRVGFAHGISVRHSSGDSSVVTALDSRLKGYQVRVPAGRAGEFSSPGSTFSCFSLLFRYPFHPRVTTVARKRSW